jgi:hypothetical protein
LSDELIKILIEVKGIIDSPHTVLLWSKYNTVEELLQDIDSFIVRLRCQDYSVIKELTVLFGPTGSLQEISIDSGWSEKYIEIANKVDGLIG